MRAILSTTAVLGSYYYCEENGAEFPDADARLGKCINDVVGDPDLNDIIQSLLCEALAQTTCRDEGQAEFKAQLNAAARLSELENLDDAARETESGKLATIYRILCRLTISGKGQETITGDRLILFGELLDAMRDSYSFSGVVDALLEQLQKDPTIGKYIDAALIKKNVEIGEYTYTVYMESIAFFLQ